ncbi:MAG: hypothetical protein JEZ12_24590 [Desulfobacterium sp.]|nr:hypothetical protein [Desulfobacterium sp.]
MRVLLVEDSERLQTYIGIAFKKAGIAVDKTGDGEEGLFLSENVPYDHSRPWVFHGLKRE